MFSFFFPLRRQSVAPVVTGCQIPCSFKLHVPRCVVDSAHSHAPGGRGFESPRTPLSVASQPRVAFFLVLQESLVAVATIEINFFQRNFSFEGLRIFDI